MCLWLAIVESRTYPVPQYISNLFCVWNHTDSKFEGSAICWFDPAMSGSYVKWKVPSEMVVGSQRQNTNILTI